MTGVYGLGGARQRPRTGRRPLPKRADKPTVNVYVPVT